MYRSVGLSVWSLILEPFFPKSPCFSKPPFSVLGGLQGLSPPPTKHNTRGHFFAVEFDVGRNLEFNDYPDNNHVVIELNNIESAKMATAVYCTPMRAI
ncbi:membrane-associated progesterone binding protein 3 [Actinidia rufa]|uniref:Membrane-associated progesterone binding protein 3 n=1 Tax=Actinidia rufa TaxID=165716 RepID=A0A7J0ELF1_9ERIC|nr:membrane-associated progesterone binding protein 3 [Actinidia rufa]